MSYLSFNQIKIPKATPKEISEKYNQGYVFTRVSKGSMDQTRSVRVNLENFKTSSENRRILKKIDGVTLEKHTLPYENYHWSIGKLGKDFYDTKFKKATFSANKIKQLCTNDESNFNTLLKYSYNKKPLGYCICYENDSILHYSYPFYDLSQNEVSNLGMGMMVLAILYAQEANKQYIYLGSAQRPTDKYKLQFKGLEWFNQKNWSRDLKELKGILKNIS